PVDDVERGLRGLVPGMHARAPAGDDEVGTRARLAQRLGHGLAAIGHDDAVGPAQAVLAQGRRDRRPGGVAGGPRRAPRPAGHDDRSHAWRLQAPRTPPRLDSRATSLTTTPRSTALSMS